MKNFIVFDLDGTLIDTLLGITSALNKTLKEFDYPFVYDYDSAKNLVGNGARKLYLRAIKKNNFDESIEKEYKRFLVHYEEDQYISKPYEGVVETLRKLNDLGIKLIVYSNKPDKILKKIVNYAFKDIDFIAIQGQDENYPVKPDVTLLNKILKENNLYSINGLYVGDSLTDNMTANNAMLDFIFLDYGYSKANDKERVIGNIVSNFNEILNYLK